MCISCTSFFNYHSAAQGFVSCQRQGGKNHRFTIFKPRPERNGFLTVTVKEFPRGTRYSFSKKPGERISSGGPYPIYQASTPSHLCELNIARMFVANFPKTSFTVRNQFDYCDNSMDETTKELLGLSGTSTYLCFTAALIKYS